ncbi:hypothetical protein J31TS6_42660 [Brevibacillus reuszeri]|uniref:hypothetical protein n=1 Tax=Brevibacillus reuszeri TaxID=54915 RepID=UPI0013DF987F|nr:hypothetical protein [Brevibacillus reuszeri]GIO08238.1 hypothetical protein J31TS6_42660 [Brevibacillus reuszeri]
MGTILLLISLLCVAVGTWKLSRIYKADKADNKTIWWAVASVGIALFFLLKLMTDTFPT